LQVPCFVEYYVVCWRPTRAIFLTGLAGMARVPYSPAKAQHLSFMGRAGPVASFFACYRAARQSPGPLTLHESPCRPRPLRAPPPAARPPSPHQRAIYPLLRQASCPPLRRRPLQQQLHRQRSHAVLPSFISAACCSSMPSPTLTPIYQSSDHTGGYGLLQ
jgi:hypothetical protein